MHTVSGIRRVHFFVTNSSSNLLMEALDILYSELCQDSVDESHELQGKVLFSVTVSSESTRQQRNASSK